MNDPLGAFDKVRNNFLLYVKTAFHTQFPSFEREREALLRHTSDGDPGVFHQDPWIEPLPRYRSSKRLAELDTTELPALDRATIVEFAQLASQGLAGDFELFEHQLQMLRLATAGRTRRR